MRIIGVDIGSTSIKAVELDSAFGRYEVHEYHEQPIPASGNASDALRELLSGLPKAPDRIVAALRTSQVTFRNIQLPTRDKKAIQNSIVFELEDELPFPLEQAVYDYSVLSQTNQASQLHIAATVKRYIEPFLSELSTGGGDPDLLTTEAWAYRTLLNRILSPVLQETPTLLIQVGSQRTILYVHWRGYPLLSREVAWGGRDLTSAICQKYGLPFDQAEAAKKDHGFILPADQRDSATPDQLEFSKCMEDATEDLLQGIRQVELAAKGFARSAIQHVYLSGGGSLLPGLAEHLQQRMKMPVEPLHSLSAIATSGVTYSEPTDAAFSLAAGLALCLVGSERANAINLRVGPYAKLGRSRELNVSALRRPMLALLAIFVCLFASLIVQGSFYRSEIADADAKLEKGIRNFFGTVSPSAIRTYTANPSALRAQMNKDLTKQRELAKLFGPNPHDPLNFLKNLSTAVPKSIVTDMMQFQVGSAPTQSFRQASDQTVSLTFLVANLQMAEKLANVLSTKLSGLTKTPPTEATQPDGSKRYKITFTGKPTEEAYGD